MPVVLTAETIAMPGGQAIRLGFLARALPHLRSAQLGRSVCARMLTAPSVEERFDVLREDGTSAGFAKPRSEVHRDGDLHRSTHIWVVSGRNPVQLLLQLRASIKDTFPVCTCSLRDMMNDMMQKTDISVLTNKLTQGRWDVSAAGHITAGDESLPSAQREVEEELGLRVGEGGSRLQYVFSARAMASGRTERHGKFVDNEIQDVYLFRREADVQLNELVLQKEEVDRVQYWTWPDFRDAQRSGDVRFVPRTKEYVDELERFLETWSATTPNLNQHDSSA